jgi:hypothetical protein
VNSAKVGDGSLLAQDFAPGQLPQGEKGDPGEPATALWAMVNSNGTLKRGRGVASVNLTGCCQYTVTFDRSVAECSYLSTLTQASNTGGTFSSPPEGQSNAALGSSGPSGVVVETANSAGTLTAFDFNLAVFC